MSSAGILLLVFVGGYYRTCMSERHSEVLRAWKDFLPREQGGSFSITSDLLLAVHPPPSCFEILKISLSLSFYFTQSNPIHAAVAQTLPAITFF